MTSTLVAVSILLLSISTVNPSLPWDAPTAEQSTGPSDIVVLTNVSVPTSIDVHVSFDRGDVPVLDLVTTFESPPEGFRWAVIGRGQWATESAGDLAIDDCPPYSFDADGPLPPTPWAGPEVGATAGVLASGWVDFLPLRFSDRRSVELPHLGYEAQFDGAQIELPRVGGDVQLGLDWQVCDPEGASLVPVLSDRLHVSASASFGSMVVAEALPGSAARTVATWPQLVPGATPWASFEDEGRAMLRELMLFLAATLAGVAAALGAEWVLRTGVDRRAPHI